MSGNVAVTAPVQTQAQTLARGLFGRKVRRIDPITRGVMNHKFKVELLNGETYVIRIYPPSREHVVDYEPDLLRSCAGAGLPVPEVLIDSRSGPRVGISYTVYHWLPGVPLDERLPFLEPGALANLAEELLSFLQQFARLAVTGYGDLVAAKQARFGTWAEFVEEIFTLSSAAGSGSPWVSEALTELHALRRRVTSARSERPSVLTWGDISPENILLDARDRMAGVIDFEGTLAADFSLTLGFCYARYFGTPFFDALWNVWPKGEPHLDETNQFYAALRGLRLARFAGFPMPTGQARRPVDQILPGLREILKKPSNNA